MASILRSSKFVRYFSGIARNIVFNSTKETADGNFVQNSRPLCLALSNGFATAAVQKPDQNLELSLKRLDQDVRRTGRISRRDIESILDEIRHNRTASSSQSLLVIRCCGNLVPDELPEVRTALVQEIWKTLNSLSVPMDISHYNALLRVYLENEHTFSPTEFLSDLESKGIEPNRVTYQRLISRYCQQGDIDGATRILEFMREKQLPINEHVFNALIIGHSQAEDLESSRGILTVMKQAGLEPSADTYTTLLCSYAKFGDITSILSTLDECEKSEMYLLDKDIFDIIYVLAKNGYADKVDPLLLRVRKTIGYNQDAVNLILRLVNHGQEDVGYKILQTMPRSSRLDGEFSDTGTFFIKQLIKVNRPTEKILNVCRNLQESELNRKAFIVAIEAAVTSGLVDTTMALLDEMKKLQQPIRQHYFWPLFCNLSEKNENEILNILKRMEIEFGITASSETIRDYVIPNLNEKNPDKIITLLRTAGVSVSTAATSLTYHLLSNYQLKDAANVALSYNVYYQPGLFRRPLVFALLKTGDVDSYIQFVRQLHDSIPRLEQIRKQHQQQQQTNEIVEEDISIVSEDGESIDASGVGSMTTLTNQSEILGQILFDVIVHMRKDRAIIIPKILTEIVAQGLTISNNQAEKIQDRLGSELSKEISELLGKLAGGDLEPIPFDKTNGKSSTNRDASFSQLNPEQLEQLIERQDAKGGNTKNLKRMLLASCIKSRDLIKTEQILTRLSDEGYILTTGVQSQLIDLYCYHKNLDKAFEIFNEIRSKDVDFVLDDYKTVKVAAELIETGKIDKAIKFLELNKKADKENEIRSFNYKATIWRLLNSMADAGKSQELDKIFTTLEENNYIEVNNALLGPLIKVHLINNDLQMAVDKFELICGKYNCTPWKNDLACKLIQAEDATNLQRLTDISTNIHGEVNSLYDLVFSFVECGRIRQARKILETPGLRSRPQKINVACERYQQEGNVESLEGLVEATRDMNHIDRGDIYYNLLLSYCKDDQPEKALGLWTKQQEEDITPTEQFLNKLGTFLQSKQLEVPFVMPSSPLVTASPKKSTATTRKERKTPSAIETTKQQTSEPTTNSELAKFKKLIRSNDSSSATTASTTATTAAVDIDSIIEAKKKLKQKLNITDQSVYIEMLIKSDRLNEANNVVLEMLNENLHPIPRIFRFYLNKLANSGDTDLLKKIETHLTDDMKKMVSFDNRVCQAHLVAGKVEQYISKLEQDFRQAKNDKERTEIADKFPRGGAIGILNDHPEFLDKFESIAELYASHDHHGPMNVLWLHHFVNDNVEIHERIWEKYVQHTKRLMFQHVIHVARDQQNENLIKNLIKKLHSVKTTDGALGIAYSCLLDIQTAKEQLDDGLKTIDEAVKYISLENLNRTALQRIQEIAIKQNKKFPHEIPAKLKNSSTQNNKNITQSSSTSSSSSGTSSSSSDDDDNPPPPVKKTK